MIDYDLVARRYRGLLVETNEKMRVKHSNLLQHVNVRMHGLEGQPDLNGLTGTVLAWDDNKQRYNIYISAKSKSVSLRPSNIVLDTGSVGRIVGLVSKPELNCKLGTITSFNSESGRYEIQLSAD